MNRGLSADVTSSVPGVVIDHSSPKTGRFIGSPSLMVLPTGEYVAAHDFFGSGATTEITVLFASKDHGKSWTPRGEVAGQGCSTLFVHRKALYLMGTSREYGFVVIRRSTDAGRTWTVPRDAASGLLLADGRYHSAPVPVVFHNGRIWRGMEEAPGDGDQGREFRALMMSAPEVTDLLQATNWTCSRRLGGEVAWRDGNAVPTPDGKLVDILGVDLRGQPEQAAIIEISDDGRQASFNLTNGFIEFPGGGQKFTIRFDQKSQCYWTLANAGLPSSAGPNSSRARNTLALVSSPDLRHWTVKCVVLHQPDPAKHSFQAADWQFDKNDLIVVCRMGYAEGDGGESGTQDDSFLTYHQIKNFRTLAVRAFPSMR